MKAGSHSGALIGFRAVQEARLAARFRNAAAIQAGLIVVVLYVLLPSEIFLFAFAGTALLHTMLDKNSDSELIRSFRSLLAFITVPIKFFRAQITAVYVHLAGWREADEFRRVESLLRSREDNFQHWEKIEFGLLLRPFEADFRELVIDRDALKSERSPPPMEDAASYIVSSVVRSFTTVQVIESLIQFSVDASDSFGTRPVDFFDWLAATAADRAPLVTVGLRKHAPYGGPNYIPVEEGPWQELVAKMIGRCRWLIFVPGTSSGVLWEAEHIFQFSLKKSIIVMLPSYTVSLSDEPAQISSTGFDVVDPDPAKMQNRRDTWAALTDVACRLGVMLPEYHKDGGLVLLTSAGRCERLDFPYTFQDLHSAVRSLGKSHVS